MATSSVNNAMISANSLYGVSGTGYKGIASGLDTDTIIDGMTAATRGKIAKQLQRKQIFQWKADAYRSVSSKLIDFAKKYTSFTSSTNLMSTSFFTQSTITPKGSNSSSVSISGSSSTASDLSILGIKQLATTASTSWSGVSDKVLATGEFDLAGTTQQSLVAGSGITLQYGSSTVSLSLDTDQEYSSMKSVADALNVALKEEGMDTKIEFKAEGNKLSLLNKGEGNNTLEIKSGTESFLDLVGFKAGDKLEKTGDTLTGKEVTEFTKQVDTVAALAGKSISFTYNGVTKSITLPKDGTEINTGEKLEKTIQDQLDSAFGEKRIKVEFEGSDDLGKLKITTVKADGSSDDSSVIAMSYADSGVMGKNGVFKVADGESNRINLEATIKDTFEASLDTAGLRKIITQVDGKYQIKINDKAITFNATDTMKDVITKINNSDAKVKVSYATTADMFTFVATESGSSGKIKIGDGESVEGKDAIATVSFNGTDTMDIVRNSNTFTMDGLNITLNSTFGYKEVKGAENTVTLELDKTQEAITFSSKVDSDKVLDAVKTMITDYNDMVDYINKELTTKRNNSSKSSYPPLTAEQKKDMSESEIETWEEKAKAGMLFNDPDIRSLSSSLRFVLSSASSTDLAKMGITTSTSYAENGKITLDEAKFKAALESNPEGVKDVFLAEKTETSLGGMMTQMKAITDKFASTTGATKGILIEKAGSPSAPTSLLKNHLLSQMNDIDKIVDGLKSTLKAQVNRYTNQFTQLERLISQMNTQSEWLAQQFSY